MQKRVLVTGASGLIGSALVTALVGQGYSVNALSRREKPQQSPFIKSFRWDVSAGSIDENCINGVNAIIHLAGENIASLPWSNRRKEDIVESRVRSIGMLYEILENRPHQVKTVVSASATGYYSHRGDELMTEDKPPADDFLGQTCLKWERAVAEGKGLGLRTVSLRTGSVLASAGGIYNKLTKAVKMGLGAVPGTGKQWMPWIHIDDVLSIYILAMEHNGIQGVYNMTAPQQINFSSFIHAIAQHVGKRIWLPHIPAFALRAILGQMSELMLSSTRVSAEKIRNAGFVFKYPEIDSAIESL